MHLSVIELARTPLRGETPTLSLRWGFETTSQPFTARACFINNPAASGR